MSTPTISVIIPVYNTAEYLNQCLQSLVDQSFWQFEAICVEDCSTDGSKAIVQEFCRNDSRFLLVEHRQNRGQAQARNTALQLAKGEYLLFLDSDDWLHKDALKALLDAAQADEVDIVEGGILKFDENTGQYSHTYHRNTYGTRNYRKVTVFQAKPLRNSDIVWNKLIRRDFLERSGVKFNSGLKRFEDTGVSEKWLLSGATVTVLPQVTYYYRWRFKDEGDRSHRKPGGESAVAWHRICYVRDLLEFEIQREVLGEDIILPPRLDFVFQQVAAFLATPGLEPDTRAQTIQGLRSLCLRMPDTYILNLPPYLHLSCGLILKNELGLFQVLSQFVARQRTETQKLQTRIDQLEKNNPLYGWLLGTGFSQWVARKLPGSVKDRIRNVLRMK